MGRSDQPVVGGRSAELDAWYRAINPHYFAAMEIPLLNGRVLTDNDSAGGAPVIVINQALARAAFPNGEALGQALVIGGGYLTDARDLRPRTIVGIVGDTRERGLRFAPTLTTYVPVAQSPEPITRLVLEKIPLRWVLRTDREPTDLVPARAASGAGRRSDPAGRRFREDVRRLGTLDFTPPLQHVDADHVQRPGPCARGDRRLWLDGLCRRAAHARDRHPRVARGKPDTARARPPGAGRCGCVLPGTTLGLVGAIFLGRFLRSLLFGISATDGLTIVVVIATMTAVVVAATYLPASRASRIDPILALRQE